MAYSLIKKFIKRKIFIIDNQILNRSARDKYAPNPFFIRKFCIIFGRNKMYKQSEKHKPVD